MTADELESLYQAAMAEHHVGRLDAALAAYQHILSADDRFARAWHLLGVGLHQQNQTPQAIACIERAIALEPQWAVFYTNLGLIYISIARSEDAVLNLRRALELAPGDASALHALGCLLVAQNRCDEALACFRSIVQQDPHNAAALSQLGLACSEVGLVDESIAAYLRAYEVSGVSLLRILAASQLPLVYRSPADVAHWRQRLNAEIDALLAGNVAADITHSAAVPIFSLPHQGFNDLELQKKYARLFRVPNLAEKGWQPRQDNRIRVGFLSAYFYQHTIGKLFAGLITTLSRDEFHVTLFSVGQHDDLLSRELAAAVDRNVVLPADLPLCRRLVLENSVDVLVFADVAMHASTYALAFSRLAPVQCTTWGHPETTGLPSIDYFISSDLMETAEADAHYSEQLVRFPSLSLVFRRSALPAAPILTRADLGLDPATRLYACPQSIYKFHPDFDTVLAGILRRDPGGHVAVIHWAYTEADDQLRDRFARSLPDVADRIVFVRRLEQTEYLQFLSLVDVLLDPFPYGGGNTTLEGFSLGVPVVTLPTPFLRGRITQAFCRRLGVETCIAKSIADYIDIAVRLGADPALRSHLRAQTLANHSRLFDDLSATRDWEAFLRQAVR